jgi:HPt (histidine-containing phosphotransfer) domain-containing protein
MLNPAAAGEQDASDRFPSPLPLESAPTQPTTADKEVLDVTVLRQLVELGGPEFTLELYQEFEVEAGELLRDAAPQVAAGDFVGLLPMLHQLKGTAATLGGVALAAQARHLEKQFKENYTDQGVAGFQLLQHYFATFLAEYPRAVEAASQPSVI